MMGRIQTSSAGQVKVEGDHATLFFERHLPYPIDTVWQAITEPEILSEWYMPDSRIEGRLGGTVEFSSRNGRVTGSVLVWDPPHVLEHEWIVERQGFSKGEYGVVRWELNSRENETILKLTHQKLPSDIARNFAPGVHAILDRLEAFLNNSPLPDWMKRSEELQSIYKSS